MNIQQQSRKKYYYRINRVVDYIDAHLDEEHTLENLSEVAHFSPFHFHRIFRVLTGETINNYVKRIRLQRAGSMLISDHQRSVSEVSALCGFNSTAVFCRAFRAHFGRSTGEFRDHHLEQESKNGQTKRNNGQFPTGSTEYFSDEFLNLNRNTNMETNIAVKEMPAKDLIYCRHVGQFDQIGGAYEKLMKWAGPRGLLRFPETKTLTVYHDDPKVVDIEKLRQSACITVDEDAKPEGESGKCIFLVASMPWAALRSSPTSLAKPGMRCAAGWPTVDTSPPMATPTNTTPKSIPMKIPPPLPWIFVCRLNRCKD